MHHSLLKSQTHSRYNRQHFFVQVDFNPSLPTPKEKDEFLIPKGVDVVSGQTNGITLHLDAEAYDHGYTPSAGKEKVKIIVWSQNFLTNIIFLTFQVLVLAWL